MLQRGIHPEGLPATARLCKATWVSSEPAGRSLALQDTLQGFLWLAPSRMPTAPSERGHLAAGRRTMRPSISHWGGPAGSSLMSSRGGAGLPRSRLRLAARLRPPRPATASRRRATAAGSATEPPIANGGKLAIAQRRHHQPQSESGKHRGVRNQSVRSSVRPSVCLSLSITPWRFDNQQPDGVVTTSGYCSLGLSSAVPGVAGIDR